MIENENTLALAARAAGEEMPGTDPAALSEWIEADAGAQADLEEMTRLCALLQETTPGDVPDSTGPTRSGFVRRVLFPAVGVAAVVLVMVAVFWKPPVPPSPPVEHPIPQPKNPVSAPRSNPLLPLLAEAEGHPAGPRLGAAAIVANNGIVEERRMGAPAPGATEPDVPDVLVPIAGQFDFGVRAPVRLPAGFRLHRARILRKQEGLTGDCLWIEYRGEEGVLVIAQARRLRAPLRSGWTTVVETPDGSQIFATSPSLDEEALRAILASLRPVM